MSELLRTLLPPGGFSNLVGHGVAALDAGLDALKAAARAVPEAAFERAPAPPVPSPAAALRAAGEREAQWVHAALGHVPTPPAPRPGSGRDALLGWLDAVRTVTVMVLRPLADRDLERLIELPGVPGRTSLRRLLSDLLEHQAERRAEVRLAAPPR
jgi:hypothetical protein